MKKTCSDREIRGIILDKLLRNSLIGNNYTSTDSFERSVSKRLKKNGKRVKRIINDMNKEGFLEFKKSRKTISINRHRVREADRQRREILGV